MRYIVRSGNEPQMEYMFKRIYSRTEGGLWSTDEEVSNLLRTQNGDTTIFHNNLFNILQQQLGSHERDFSDVGGVSVEVDFSPNEIDAIKNNINIFNSNLFKIG